MQLAVFALRLLEVMFFVGLAGSAVVVLISFIEDAQELFGEDEKPRPRLDLRWLSSSVPRSQNLLSSAKSEMNSNPLSNCTRTTIAAR